MGKLKGKKIIAMHHIANMKPFSAHDLRRLAATARGEYLIIEPHVGVETFGVD